MGCYNLSGNYRETSITTTEKTWMYLDVSPNGLEAVFDLRVIFIYFRYLEVMPKL